MSASAEALLAVVPADLHDGVVRWLSKVPTAEATVQLLLSLYQEGAPYADELVQFVVLAARPAHAHELKKLRILIHTWRFENRASALGEINFRGLVHATQKYSREVGYRLLNGIQQQSIPARFLPAVRVLLPDVFLPMLGWQNFAPTIPETIIQVIENSSGAKGKEVPEEFEKIARYLYKLKDKIYIKELFLIAACLMREGGKHYERNSAISIYSLLRNTKAFLNYLFEELRIGSVGDFDPDLHVTKYIASSQSRRTSGTRFKHYQDYSAGLQAVERWHENHPKTRKILETWSLPLPTREFDRSGLAATASAGSRARRHARMNELMPAYLPLLSVVYRRALVFREIFIAFNHALKYYGADVTRDYRFSVTLSDGSATLQFIILQQSKHDRLNINSENLIDRQTVLCEYLGATDTSGRFLSLPFFCLMQRAWYDKAYRIEIAQYELLDSDCDLGGTMSGLLRPAGTLNSICRREYIQNESNPHKPRILLSIDAMCVGAAFGALALMVDYSSNMRLHEVQQIRGERHYVTLDDTGHIGCLIYRKGCKGAKLKGEKMILEPFIQPFFQTATSTKTICNGPFQRIHMHKGKEYGLSAGLYIFQWSGRAMSQHALSSLMRFMAFGVAYKSPGEEFKNLRAHDLRHGQLRGQQALGRSLRAIQESAGHQDSWMTKFYLGDLTDIDLGQVPPITMWAAMLPEAISELRTDSA